MRSLVAEADVEEFIRKKGVTKCPTVFLDRTQGSISESDRAAIRKYAAEREQKRQKKLPPKMRESIRLGSQRTQNAKSNTFLAEVRPIFEELLASGAVSNAKLAAELNQRGIVTYSNANWTGGSVRATMLKLGMIEKKNPGA